MTSYEVPDSKGYATLVKLKGLTAMFTFPAVSVTVPCMHQFTRNQLKALQRFISCPPNHAAVQHVLSPC